LNLGEINIWEKNESPVAEAKETKANLLWYSVEGVGGWFPVTKQKGKPAIPALLIPCWVENSDKVEHTYHEKSVLNFFVLVVQFTVVILAFALKARENQYNFIL
jgi:hypothetical protein